MVGALLIIQAVTADTLNTDHNRKPTDALVGLKFQHYPEGISCLDQHRQVV